MNRFAAAPLTLILLVLGLAACGGGGGGSAPSKADFAASANKTCTETQQHLQDLGKATSTDEVANQIDKVIGEMKTSVDKLKDLDQPDGAAGDAAEKFVNATESDIDGKGVPALQDLRDAIKTKDQKAAQKAYQSLQAINTTNSQKLARAAGVKSCAN
jgi:hypothetical protein